MHLYGIWWGEASRGGWIHAAVTSWCCRPASNSQRAAGAEVFRYRRSLGQLLMLCVASSGHASGGARTSSGKRIWQKTAGVLLDRLPGTRSSRRLLMSQRRRLQVSNSFTCFQSSLISSFRQVKTHAIHIVCSSSIIEPIANAASTFIPTTSTSSSDSGRLLQWTNCQKRSCH